MTKHSRKKNKQTKKKQLNKQKSVDELMKLAADAVQIFEYENAINYLREALKIEPNNTIIMDQLGETLLMNNLPEDARLLFEKSVKMEPNKGYMKYMYLGQIYEGKKSVECFQRGIEILQNMLKNNEEFEGGKEELKRTIANGYCSIAELYMTDLCFEENAPEIIENVLNLALQLDENNVQIFQTMASLRLSQQRNDEAREFMKKVMSIYDQSYHDISYDFKMSTAKILMEIGELEASEKLLGRLVMEFDEVVDVWYLLGINYKMQNDFKGAVENIQKAINLAKSMNEDELFIKEMTQDLEICQQKLKELPPEEEEEEEEEEEDIMEDDEMEE